MKKNYLTILAILAIAIPTSGCLKIFRPDNQQGNQIEEHKLSQLQPNMSKEEVQAILGTPAIVPTIDINRWDYQYRFKKNYKPVVEKKLTLFFVNNKLKSYNGDYKIPTLKINKNKS